MSNFVVSARKYRPTRFEDVVGQDHVSNTLKNALQTDKLAHAFLFCGPRGVGKTTCARILAKVINCENPIDKVEPCNKCSSCTSFNDNASFNIIELDAASNNSVEHIRTLIEQVRFQPQQGTHKVFIIDEVHMLSSQAFNAFLKTLEEPPPYAIFILATTEKHKILPTILSRCQLFDFKRIQPSGVVSQLNHICQQEGITASPEALHQIALKSDGAMRDALSIFDKIASAVNGNITYKDVIQNLNILDYEYFFQLVDAFLKSDVARGFIILDEVMHNGFEPEQLVQGLASHLRELLVSKDTQTIKLMEVSQDQKKRYFEQARLCTESFLLSSLETLNQCDINFARASNKRLATEIALSKLVYFTYLNSENAFEANSEVKKNSSSYLTQASEVETEPSVSQKIDVSTSEETVPVTNDQKVTASQVTQSQSVEKQEEVEKKDVDQSSESSTPPNTPTDKTIPPPPTPVLEGLDDLLIGGASLSSVKSIKKNLHSKEQALKEARKSMNTEKIQEIWDRYAEEHDSPSVKAAMSTTFLKFDQKKLIVTVPSEFTQTAINQELNLISTLRDTFGAYDLQFEYIIDKSKFPNLQEVELKKVYSNQEKYEKLNEKNPLLKELINKLDLVVDSGRQ